jgi:hypothetical protein
MTHEQRLDRLERIAKLFVRSGVRYRRDLRELGDKINIMVDAQIKNEKRFQQNEAAFQSRSVVYEARFHQNETAFQSRSAEYEKRFNKNEERLAKLSEKTEQKFVELAESQARSQAGTDRSLADLAASQSRTDRSLAELIKISKRERNGNSQKDS